VRTQNAYRFSTLLAEGIETREQWQFLARAGCAKGQGYLFAKPASLAQLLPAIEAAARLVGDTRGPTSEETRSAIVAA